MRTSWLALVLVVAFASGCKAQVLGKPVSLLERDWQEFVTLLRTEESTSSFFKKHATERIKAWKEAADRGLVKGQVFYGLCLVQGIGVAKDQPNAIALFTSAAEKGDAVAMLQMGTYCIQNRGYREGVEWYRKSADAGEASAFAKLSMIYAIGVGDDKQKSFKFALQAAERGSPLGMTLCAGHLTEGEGVEQNSKAAAQWYRKAVELGQSDAMELLGELYEKGKGVEKNQAEAVRLYRMAATKANVTAILRLAWCHQNGFGVEQSDTCSAILFTLASCHGSTYALFKLGACFQQGIGVCKSDVVAALLFE
jgi:TPR repeat protein